jgi:hypothetical protein
MVEPRNHPKLVHFGIETWAPSISRNPISVPLLFEEFDGHNFRARLQFLVKATQALRPTPAGLADARLRKPGKPGVANWENRTKLKAARLCGKTLCCCN